MGQSDLGLEPHFAWPDVDTSTCVNGLEGVRKVEAGI